MYGCKILIAKILAYCTQTLGSWILPDGESFPRTLANCCFCTAAPMPDSSLFSKRAIRAAVIAAAVMVALRIASAIDAAAATPAAWGQAPSTNWHELPGSQPIPGGLALRPILLSFY